uniref:FAT domain-containing protein n=1 Tax=Steinernema glaseri TaxID=37863 RepID=A0A1I8A5M2_9BILA
MAYFLQLLGGRRLGDLLLQRGDEPYSLLLHLLHHLNSLPSLNFASQLIKPVVDLLLLPLHHRQLLPSQAVYKYQESGYLILCPPWVSSVTLRATCILVRCSGTSSTTLTSFW